MPPVSVCRFSGFFLSAGLLVSTLFLEGCTSGLFHTNAVVGPDLKPHVTSAVSIPFGK